MNQVRREWIVDCANTATETLKLGTHRTISRERIQELVNIIAELMQEIDDLNKVKDKSEPSKAFRERLTDNAENFDSIVSDMLKHIDDLEKDK
jgi:hypothetical protein